MQLLVNFHKGENKEKVKDTVVIGVLLENFHFRFN